MLTSKVMLMVGSSTVRLGNGSTFAGSQSVSDTLGSAMPAKATMSPALGRVHLDAGQAVKSQDLRDALGALVALAVDDRHRHAALSVPRLMRPMPMAPT